MFKQRSPCFLKRNWRRWTVCF
uniref:Uncharacterized protein n=1 Tax=Anguilla anguilla TaxID=7936 RepID=A0A0E9S9L1_ANGAN